MALRFIFALLAALLVVGPASAVTTAHIGAGFVNVPGFSSGNGFPQCGGASMPYEQCVQIPNVSGVAGTLTVKQPGIEVLIVLQCGSTVVWVGEAFSGTVPVNVTLPGTVGGPCAAWWQEINWSNVTNNAGVGASGDWEYQFTFYGP